MPLTLGVVTDLHFGPEARFDGKLRKLSHQAEQLCRLFASEMRHHARPDLLVNLGDVVEDESPAADGSRYQLCQEILRSSGLEVVNVAGNHDCAHLTPPELRRFWGMSAAGPLHRSFDRSGVHVVVLHTHERKDVDVTIDAEQLGWLSADLAANTNPVIVLMHHSASDQILQGNRWFSKAPHLCLVKERRELRALLRRDGNTVCVLNGHLHWNHLDVIDGIPYVTLQSLIENVDEDAPGRAAAAHAIVRLTNRSLAIDVRGEHPARYQFALL